MKTAFITGATEGIGLELARLFAKEKTNLILVARNEIRLQETAGELKDYGIEVNLYSKDLSLIENAVFIYEDIKRKDIVIDYVVNCAGIGVNKDYADGAWENELKMFNLNMITLAYFTKAFASDMKQRKYGKILNVSSTASSVSLPFMAGYSATKAFVLNLSEIVNFELKGTGVTVTTLCPGVTDTKFHLTTNTVEELVLNKLIPLSTPYEVAKYGYKIMMKGKSSGIHGFLNRVLVFSSKLVCKQFQLYIASVLLKK